MAVPPSPHRRTVLLVDDEQDVLDSIREVLEWGIPNLDVVTATSGKAGLTILDRRSVDLVVSDFKMPGMDGLEFLDQCGLRHPRVPRAILTAFLTDDLEKRAKPTAPIAAFLSKAADPGVLLDWVRRRLESVPANAVASLARAGVPPAPRIPVK